MILQMDGKTVNPDDEFGFNDASTNGGHSGQSGVLTWFCNETSIMVSITKTNLFK